MASNRVRTMPTDELVQRVVVHLVDVMQKQHQTAADLHLANRLYRELQRRTADGTTHPESCMCETCCYGLDDPFMASSEFHL